VIAGFRGGISFVPDGAWNGGFLPATGPGPFASVTLQSLTAANIAVPGVGGFAAGTAGLPVTGTPGLGNVKGAYGDYKDWVEIGGQWRGTFGDVGLGVMAEYTHATHKASLFSPTAGVTSGLQFGAAGLGGYNFIDINSFAVGGQVSWMGLTVGGSFSDHFRSTYLTGPGLQRGQDAYAYVAGIQYAIGPWVVGYNYSYTLDAGSVSPLNVRALGGGSNINEWHSVGAKYILAPGLFLFTEYGNVRVQSNGTNVNYANVGVVGTGIRF
jgi:hypothetical protein